MNREQPGTETGREGVRDSLEVSDQWNPPHRSANSQGGRPKPQHDIPAISGLPWPYPLFLFGRDEAGQTAGRRLQLLGNSRGLDVPIQQTLIVLDTILGTQRELVLCPAESDGSGMTHQLCHFGPCGLGKMGSALFEPWFAQL